MKRLVHSPFGNTGNLVPSGVRWCWILQQESLFRGASAFSRRVGFGTYLAQ